MPKSGLESGRWFEVEQSGLGAGAWVPNTGPEAREETSENQGEGKTVCTTMKPLVVTYRPLTLGKDQRDELEQEQKVEAPHDEGGACGAVVSGKTWRSVAPTREREKQDLWGLPL